MIYSVNYEELAGQVNPAVFKRYLLGNGWVQHNTKRDDVFVLRYKKDGQFEQVMLPNDPEFSDYALGLYMAVQDVAKLENRTVDQVLLTLLNPHSDIVTVRVTDPRFVPGSVSFDAVIALYEKTRELIAASACDVLYPLKWHTGCPDDDVQEFVSLCRFGQTEVGSLVVPVVCPLLCADGDSYRQLTVFDSDETCAQSLTRSATRHIVEGIHSIKSAIDTDTPLSIPVSADFCDAVAGICGLGPEAEVAFQVQWSPVFRQNIPSFSSVELCRDYVAPLNTISRSLRPNTERRTRIVGRILRLSADPFLENRQSGQIEVEYLDEREKAGFLIATLDVESYMEAIEAHREGQYVSIKGTIPEGSKNMNCTSFRVITD